MAGARRSRFCPHCGSALPPDAPRFCIECGKPLRSGHSGAPPPPPPVAAGPTVRLGNARVAQSVIGGTVKLPTSGAIPPGLWVRDEAPNQDDVVAIYPPLRAVVGGWSGQRGRGWNFVEREAHGTQQTFTFSSEVEWFPAPGCGEGLRLTVTVLARSRAEEGKERRGFRYRIGSDSPMEISDCRWRNADNASVNHPIPQVQIMAPPRIPRVSDLNETIAVMSQSAAERWIIGGATPGIYRLRLGQDSQEHTPVGRGITLVPMPDDTPPPAWWKRIIGTGLSGRFMVRIERPFICTLEEWERRMPRIRDEARNLGLANEPALAAEWWLDQHGHDGVILTAARERFDSDQVVIAFRRGQLVQLR